MKNIHSCHILAQSQYMFYVHQASMITHRCTKYEKKSLQALLTNHCGWMLGRTQGHTSPILRFLSGGNQWGMTRVDG